MITFSTYDSTINSYYLAFYGRPADPSGLKFWSQALVANNGDTSAIIQAFATSDEAQVRFGSDTLAARVTEIYQQLFNRAPDAAGLAYWTDAVEQGKASLADVAVAILKGAQSSDLDLSTMRQKAADAFTTAVENGSTEYSGYASIEAARVLVRAVTVDANDADLAKLVKAAVSFADTATKNPKVVDAIATGSTLLNLYDSARGLKDPVALTQALADTAKAAAGDPVTLESLLRGGGMDKVLKVMPAKATLLDVVEALAKGGLPAAVDVVYPPAKPAPVPTIPMELKFESVSQGPFDTNKKDNVTNVEKATVTFSYTGSDLKAGQGFEYSTDGGTTWSNSGVSANVATNIVTIKGVDLAGKKMLPSAVSADFTTQGGIETVANHITNVQLRAVDAAKKVIAEQSAKIEFDNTPPTGLVEFKGIVYGNSCTMTDPVATFEKIFFLDDAVIQWHIEGAADWIDMDQSESGSSFKLPNLDLNKSQVIDVRVIDAAGNVGYEKSQQIGTATDSSGGGDNGGGVGPAVSQYYASQYIFSASSSLIWMGSLPDSVAQAQGQGNKGFLNSAGFQLTDLSPDGGSTSYYVGGSSFGVTGLGQLSLANPLVAGLYEMKWSEGTFATTKGVLGAASQMFAGGFDGMVVQQGFAINGRETMHGNTIDATANLDSVAYVIDGIGNVLTTGRAQDVVFAGAGSVELHYDRLESTAQDLIIGFGQDDSIKLFGDVANYVSKDHNNEISWKFGVEVIMDEMTEAVYIETSGAIVSDELSKEGSATLQTLNAHLAMTSIKYDTALILVRDVSGLNESGALLHYTAINENGKIDANEVTLIAMFSDGVPDMDQITLVGLSE